MTQLSASDTSLAIKKRVSNPNLNARLARFASLWPLYFGRVAQACFILTCFFIPLSTTIMDIGFALTAGLALISGIPWQRKAQIIRSPVVKVALAAVAVILIGLTYTWAPIGEALHMSKKYLWLVFIPLFFGLNRSSQFCTYALYSFLAAMLITLFFSYTNYWGWVPISFVKATDSIFKDHIVQNFLMSVVVLICMLRIRSPGWQRFAYLLLALLASINILFICEGRIGYILLPIMIFYGWQVNYGWRKLYLPILGLGILFCVAVLFSSHLQERVQMTEDNLTTYDISSVKKAHTSLGIRITMLNIGARVVARHPWFGYGTGSIHTILAKIPKAWVSKNKWIRKTNTFENAYLHIVIQFGAIGLILFLFGAGYLWRHTQEIEDHFYRSLMRGFLIAIAVGCLLNPWLESTTESHLLALFLAICFSKTGLNRLPATSASNSQ